MRKNSSNLGPVVGDRGGDATAVGLSGSPREAADTGSSAVAVRKAAAAEAVLGVRPVHTGRFLMSLIYVGRVLQGQRGVAGSEMN